MSALKICPQCGTEYPANARFCEVDGTTLRSAGGDTELVGSIVADRYHILKKLGEGGMGQVYLVEHVKMGRKSALKVMNPGMVKDVDAISRFNREASNASRINHPNVAAVYDFGETADGIIYLAMEFVDGPPLTAVIEQNGALPPKRAAEIVRQTAEALAVAHDMGIVHRDLKPDNIMIAKTRDGGDLVKVVDFGIAKAAGSEAQKVTKTGLVVGTPEYMSPEQLSGDKLDGRSDIYSLGLVAFNMLTGNLPFPSDSAQESMIMRLTDRPKPLAEMMPDRVWPADVQAVMDKALERDATKRYQTATEFGRDLARAVDRMPETIAAEIGTQVLDVPPTRVPPPPLPAPPQRRRRAAVGIAGSDAVHRRNMVPTPAQSPPRPWSSPAAAASKGPMRSSARIVGDRGSPPSRRRCPVMNKQRRTVRRRPDRVRRLLPVAAERRRFERSRATSSPPNRREPTSRGPRRSPRRLFRWPISCVPRSTTRRIRPRRLAYCPCSPGLVAANWSTSPDDLVRAALRANVFTAKGTKRDTIRACSELKKVVPSLAKEQADEANERIATQSRTLPVR